MRYLLGRGLLATTLCAGACASDSPPPEPEEQQLFLGGSEGYNIFRIPALIKTSAGTLLAFAEGRQTLQDDGNIDLVLKRSEDGGQTWSPLQLVHDFGEDTAGNPAPVVDSESGRIWLPFSTNPGDSMFDRSQWLMHSDDDGLSWSEPVEITSQVKEPNWSWYASGPGRSIQLESGRLVIPSNRQDEQGVRRAHAIYSDDAGETWNRSTELAEGTDEATVAQLADGRLYMNTRYDNEELFVRAVSWSEDDGETWSETIFDDALPDPVSQGSLLQTSHGLMFCNSNSQALLVRENLTCRLSDDGGETWHTSKVVQPGPGAYSSLEELGDGRYGLLYENGQLLPYDGLAYLTFTIDWLRAPPRAE